MVALSDAQKKANEKYLKNNCNCSEPLIGIL